MLVNMTLEHSSDDYKCDIFTTSDGSAAGSAIRTSVHHQTRPKTNTREIEVDDGKRNGTKRNRIGKKMEEASDEISRQVSWDLHDLDGTTRIWYSLKRRAWMKLDDRERMMHMHRARFDASVSRRKKMVKTTSNSLIHQHDIEQLQKNSEKDGLMYHCLALP
ncbi:hypothetical protein OUZ56_008336 [Daphnia magna]|uniref:Uncharacterized protein n=1 Tax=Daphnia magna TaxID=35525 RepID=A0ABR0ACQ4_9CRUS|nr:hypothetical protein OUZ56_008336 [Daphnia magna]